MPSSWWIPRGYFQDFVCFKDRNGISSHCIYSFIFNLFFLIWGASVLRFILSSLVYHQRCTKEATSQKWVLPSDCILVKLFLRCRLNGNEVASFYDQNHESNHKNSMVGQSTLLNLKIGDKVQVRRLQNFINQMQIKLSSNLESLVGSNIQSTGILEFEDVLRTGVLPGG